MAKWGCYFKGGSQGSLSKKIVMEQRPEDDKGANHTAIFQAEESDQQMPESRNGYIFSVFKEQQGIMGQVE